MIRASLVFVAILGLFACTMVPAVPTTPLAGQSQRQEERDARECAQAAKGDGAPSYEACMVSRRYKVAHHVIGSYGSGFGVQEIDLTMNTEITEPRTADQVARDIDACRNHLRQKGTKAIMGYAEPDRVLKLARYYTECMEPRGYKLTRWEPKR
jgi:hypothetical protein